MGRKKKSQGEKLLFGWQAILGSLSLHKIRVPTVWWTQVSTLRHFTARGRHHCCKSSDGLHHGHWSREFSRSFLGCHPARLGWVPSRTVCIQQVSVVRWFSVAFYGSYSHLRGCLLTDGSTHSQQSLPSGQCKNHTMNFWIHGGFCCFFKSIFIALAWIPWSIITKILYFYQ